jgi:hypothetical protein
MRSIIRKFLLENDYQNKKELSKKSLFKLWDREKSMGKKPKIHYALIKTLNMSYYDISELLVEWYGGIEKVYRLIKNRLVNKVITTNNLEGLGVRVGGYDFRFSIEELYLRKSQGGGYEFEVPLKIIDGGVSIYDGSYIDLTDIDSINDNLWWELSYEIKDIIKDFINLIAKEYGFNVLLDDINIDFV